MTTTIVALQKSILDPNTEAVGVRHVIDQYTVDNSNAVTRVRLSAFVTATAKRPAFSSTMTLPGLPVGDGSQWIYQQLLAEKNQTEANHFTGAAPVMAAEGVGEGVEEGSAA